MVCTRVYNGMWKERRIFFRTCPIYETVTAGADCIYYDYFPEFSVFQEATLAQLATQIYKI